MGLTKAELAPKNYIVHSDPAIEYVQTHSHHSQYRPASIVLLPFALAKGEQWLLITLNSWLALKHW